MKRIIKIIKNPNVILQKITGLIPWKGYLRLIEYCKFKKVNQMQFIGKAVEEKLDREENKEAGE